MAMEYFCCYHSYKKKCEKLTDQELGRLFRALMVYSETGEAQELAGRESIAFDFIADDIDRAKKSYDEKCRKNRENGQRGANAPERPRTVANAPQNKDKNKDENENKDKDEENIHNERQSRSGAQAHSACVEEIVEYLNEKAGTQYKATTKATRDKIVARLNEGFTVDDFRTVIDKQCREWLKKPEMAKYLRPETLFGTKFEGYLNAPERSEDGRLTGNRQKNSTWGTVL